MKISTRGRYALLLMLDLAQYYKGEPVRLKDVAKRRQISEKYLEQIIAIVSRAGLVKSIRGPQGGYMINGNPEKYTVGDVLRQTEGSLSPVTYVDEASPEWGSVTVRVWERLGSAIDDIVDGITIQDLVEWENERIGEFCI